MLMVAATLKIPSSLRLLPEVIERKKKTVCSHSRGGNCTLTALSKPILTGRVVQLAVHPFTHPASFLPVRTMPSGKQVYRNRIQLISGFQTLIQE